MPETPAPSSPPRSRFVLGLAVGQEVRCCRHLDVEGRVVVLSGTHGCVMGSAHSGKRIAVRFDTLRTNLNVFRSDVQPMATWKVGLRVEAVRSLYFAPQGQTSENFQPLIYAGSLGTVLGLASDTSKLSVKFEECPYPVNALPYDDVEPAWRADSRRAQEKEEASERRALQAEAGLSWDRISAAFTEENDREGFLLEASVSVLVADIRDDHSAPQSLTGWVRTAPEPHTNATAQMRVATPHALRKVMSRIERRILNAEGTAAHQLFFALRLYLGMGTACDFKECERWLRRAAKGQDASALNMLGILRLADRGGTPADPRAALDHFKVAASLGCAASSFNIGCVLTGYTHTLPRVPGVHDLRAALRRLRFAASKGHAGAQYRLGALLLGGQGEADVGAAGDEEEGAAWLRRSAAQGHAKAQHALGMHLLERDLHGALLFFRQAATQGHPDAQHRLGMCVFAGPVHAAADRDDTMSHSSSYSETKYFTNMAVVDTSISREDAWPFWQGQLPDRLRGFDGAFQKDMAEGVAWVREAALAGHVEAQNSLALCLLHGEKVRQDIRGGVAWLRHACNQGCVAAMHNLACCLFTGEGVDVDTRAAMDLWRQAGRAGHEESDKKLRSLAEWVFQGEEQVMQLLSERNQHAETELVLKVIAEKGLADSGRTAVIRALRALEVREQEYAVIEGRAKEHLERESEPGTPRRVVRIVLPPAPLSEASEQQRSNVPDILGIENVRANGWHAPESALGVTHVIPRPFTGGLRGEVAGGVVGQLLESQFSLGLQYLFGTFVEEDHQAAAQLFWRVADSSVVPHSGAQNVLGVCFEHGLGVPKHTKMAVHWYRKAAARQLPVAMHNLASCLFKGDGVRQNLKEAVRWWRKASDLGYVPATFRLALCELCGEGCKHNKASGLSLLDKAAEMGVTQAATLGKSIRQSGAYTEYSSEDSGPNSPAYDATLPATHSFQPLSADDLTP